jgi:DNA modification methylase
MAAVFRAVWRVLRDDGTLWVNMGDSYASQGGKRVDDAEREASAIRAAARGYDVGGWSGATKHIDRCVGPAVSGLKPKDLCMMPGRVAMALQADGWYVRSEIVWSKPNPMPESVTDRPTKAHEMIYLLAKQERYFYDAEAIREKAIDEPGTSRGGALARIGNDPFIAQNAHRGPIPLSNGYRNKRSVWTIATQPYSEAHFATFPEEIPKLCILAGSRPGDTVLDPFAGSGTVGQVALELGRRAVLIELNPAYVQLAETRTNVTPGFF